MPRNIFYVYKLQKIQIGPNGTSGRAKNSVSAHRPDTPQPPDPDVEVEVYQANEPQAEMPRARGWIPGTGMVLDPLDISLMFDWV